MAEYGPYTFAFATILLMSCSDGQTTFPDEVPNDGVRDGEDHSEAPGAESPDSGDEQSGDANPSGPGQSSSFEPRSTSATLPTAESVITSDFGPEAEVEWEVESNPGPVRLSDETASTTSVAFVQPGVYIFIARGVDAEGEPIEQRIELTVKPNEFSADDSTTVADRLANSIRPKYAADHSLPPLGSASITTHPAILKELAEHWGWALQTPMNADFCGPDAAGAMGAPSYGASHNDEILALALASEGRYPLMVSAANILPKGNGKVFATPGLNENDEPAARGALAELRDFTTPEAVWYNDGQGNGVDSRLGRLGTPDEIAAANPNFSPLAPEGWVRARVREVAECARKFQEEYPVDVVTDAAEYGFSLFDGDFCLAMNDPAVLSAVGYPDQPDPSCFGNVAGASESRIPDRDTKIQRLLGQQFIRNYKITRDEFAAATQREDGSSALFTVYGNAYGTDRGRWNGWPNFMARLEDEGDDPISFASGAEHYYLDFNTGFSGIQEQAGCAPTDILFKTLNDIGGSIANGVPYRYPWISAGYRETASDKSEIAERERWMGYMKMMFVGGALGALSGYFNYDFEDYQGRQLRNNPIGSSVPNWLWPIIDLSHVQAAFSHLEEYLLQGDLVQGATAYGAPTHPYSVDTEPVPYFALRLEGEEYTRPSCFDESKNYAPTAYVMARNVADTDRYLFGAWANIGEDREVTALLPDGGKVTLLARKAGSLYLATRLDENSWELTLVDPEPMLPSNFFFN